MARSRHEQRAELQQVMQMKPQDQTRGMEPPTRPEQSGLPEPPKAQERTPSSEGQSFSKDPSPFSQRPSLPPDSSAYRELVAIAAYYRAERRGFAPGGEVQDWLDAEQEVAARLLEQRVV
jgi:hypothetical protein